MKIRIGTRGSKLATTQTGLVAAALRDLGHETEIVEIKTVGDRKQGTAAAKFGDKKDWVYELELALLSKEIDIAVHSGKDVPGNIEAGTKLAPALKRESPFDVFIGKIENSTRIKIEQVSTNAVIGTASLRRKAQLLKSRPGLSVVDHRGNVPTRLEKLDNSQELSGIILAESGLTRLGLTNVQWQRLPLELMVPAMNQGILCVQFREADNDLPKIIDQLSDRDTKIAWLAERGCVSVLDADCNSAVGVFAQAIGDRVKVVARVLLPNGERCIDAQRDGAATDAAEVGLALGQELLNRGAKEILAESIKYRAKKLEKV